MFSVVLYLSFKTKLCIEMKPEEVIEKVKNEYPGSEDWLPMDPGEILKFVPVNLKSETGSMIKDLFTYDSYSLDVILIERIQNPKILAAYNAKRRELQVDVTEELMLFHGTTYENARKIAKENFDRSLCKRYRHGKGVSFTPNPWFASYFPDRTGLIRFMLLARVIVKGAAIGNDTMEAPPDGCDATKNESGGVIVKYDDNTFYPAFLIYFVDREHSLNVITPFNLRASYSRPNNP